MDREFQRALDEENIVFGTLAGLIASLIGAGLWATITVLTQYQIGYMAIGVGLLVAFSIRKAGHGVTAKFGVIGALLALFGCILGNILGFTYFEAQGMEQEWLAFLQSLDLKTLMEIMEFHFHSMDLLFYAIALYEGFQLSWTRPGSLEDASETQNSEAK
ncbi:MAG: hypothetical protein KDK66_09525 [Deltaproteobacteria bacterium]|nr:hypothetical protein [Deltaproteobacteria bacterium]